MFTCAYWPFLYHFFEQCLFKSFAFGLFFFLLSSYEFIYILDTGQYVIQCVICKYFLPFYELSCHFLDNVLCSTEVFNFDEVHLFFFPLVTCAFSIASKEPLLNPKPWRLTPLFSSKHGVSVIVLVHTYKSMIHVELIFVSCVTCGTNSIPLHVYILLSWLPFVEEAVSPVKVDFWTPNSIWLICVSVLDNSVTLLWLL